MFRGNNKFYLSVFSLSWLIPFNVLAQEKICLIKFNQRIGEKALERKINTSLKSNRTGIHENFYCYQIGLEHDANKMPIHNKPIYACCKQL